MVQNYGITDKEMLAAYLGIMHFDFYLRHAQFTLVTDHSGLTSMMQKQTEFKGRFARWVADLLPYNFTVVHGEGRKMQHADCLSRIKHEESVQGTPASTCAETLG